ncbi:MAG: transglutaminase-like domain-containing protein [Planctomycetota bacterium]|jgi:hypothetical protein
MTGTRRAIALALPLAFLWTSLCSAQNPIPRGIKCSKPVEKCVVGTQRLITSSGRAARDVHAYFFLPQDEVQQEVKILRFVPEPKEIITDKYGRKIAHFTVDELGEGRHAAVRWVAKVEIHHMQATVETDPKSLAGKLTDAIRDLYLADKRYYGVDSPFIKELANSIARPGTPPLERVRKIFRHLGGNLKYELAGGWDTAETVLKRGTGSCSEYTYCFIALCRAAGVPARYVGSTVLRRPKGPSFDRPKHRWAEVFIEGYGWVQVDVLQRGSLADDSFSIGNRFLILGHGDGDSDAPMGWRYTSRVRAQRSPRALEEMFWCDTVADALFDKVVDAAAGAEGGEKPAPSAAVEALAGLDAPLCIPFLADYIHHEDPVVASKAARAICRLDRRCARNVRYDVWRTKGAERAMSAALEAEARGRLKKPESGRWFDIFDGKRLSVRADPGHPFRRHGNQLVNIGGRGTVLFRHVPADRAILDLLFRHVGSGRVSLLFCVGANDLFLELPFGVAKKGNKLKGTRGKRGLYAVTERDLHRATIVLDGCRVKFILDGRTVFDVRDENVGPGRIGFTVRGEEDALSIQGFRVFDAGPERTITEILDDEEIMDTEGWPTLRRASGEKEK